MKKLITSRVVLFSILILMYAVTAFAGKNFNERSYGATLTNKGFGLRMSYNRSKSPSSMFTSDIEIINVNGKNEFTFAGYDRLGRYVQYKIGDENLLLMPLMFGYRKNLWHDQIANNFQPYLQLSGGPVLAFDLKEEDPNASEPQENVGFIEQFSKGKAYHTFGASLTAGAVIETSKKRFININVNYSLIDYGYYRHRGNGLNSGDLDGRVTIGGLAFRVEFGSWLR